MPAPLLQQLTRKYPQFTFEEGNHFSWSAARKSISYTSIEDADSAWNLLHELGHALLDHSAYTNDMELLKKEVCAWDKALELAREFGVVIDADHIEDCLDSYRDWIFKRSTCPECRAQGIQKAPERYICINCRHSWIVTKSRFCRPYRRSQ
jgi:hypothetical protein